jgi:hypothetical protein
VFKTQKKTMTKLGLFVKPSIPDKLYFGCNACKPTTFCIAFLPSVPT